MKKNFNEWLSTFQDSLATYDYYVDFKKVYKNVDRIKIELNILNSLIGSKNIKNDFKILVKKYPEVLKCIPILLAVRSYELLCQDESGKHLYDFRQKENFDGDYFACFMDKTGLFELLANHIINNLYDYVTGVEAGLSSNGRKNRTGHNMENLVEKFIQKAGFVRDKTYFKEMYANEIQSKWGVDLTEISNKGKTEKRFDFVVKTRNMIYGIEVNFYNSNGSKLNETARSYKTIALEANKIDKFTFVWVTDGKGWESAKHNLEETFDVMDNIYNINDMNNGIMKKIFV